MQSILDDTFDLDGSINLQASAEENKIIINAQASAEDGDQNLQKPITAPMPGSNFKFEIEVENALQNFVEAEHVSNMLMPSINAQIPYISESLFKEYIAKDKFFSQLYEDWSSQPQHRNSSEATRNHNSRGEEMKYNDAAGHMDYRNGSVATQISTSNSLVTQQQNTKRSTNASLMNIQGAYDEHIEKLHLFDSKKARRKVYQDQETCHELQDLYRINDSQIQQYLYGGSGNYNLQMHGRANYNRDLMQQNTLRCYLYPKVYPQSEFEQTMIQASGYNNLSNVKEYLKVLINFFKSNPYASAKLFHGIATDAFHYKPEQQRSQEENKNTNSNSQSYWSKFYEEDRGHETNTKVSWGVFLPERIRQMLFNMSKYFFDNLLAADSLDDNTANEKFFSAYKIFIQNSSNEDLFSDQEPLKLHWHFLQVIKVLFDGQTRAHTAQATLKKIFRPVYERIGISALRKQLTLVTEPTSQFVQSTQQLSEDANIVDKLREKLFDENPNYSFSYDSTFARQTSEDISDFQQLISSTDQRSTGNQRQHCNDVQMPNQISQDMFKSLSRVMPAPVLDYEKNLLEPITSIFADFQDEYAKQDQNVVADLKMLPDCHEFIFEVISTNMLMADIYAPYDRFKSYQNTQMEEEIQLRPENGSDEVKQIMTDKVIEICKNVLESLWKLRSEIPFRLRFMISLILDKRHQNQQRSPIDEHDAPLIADFLAGSWLSNAFRWPECIGMEPCFKEEALTLGHLLTACRLVLEATLSCKELPYNKAGHRTYKLTEINSFIRNKRVSVLNLYNEIFKSIDSSIISHMSFQEMRQQNATKPIPPREIFEASLMRTQDLATLVKLVQWQFQEHWNMVNSYELRLDFKDSGGSLMLNENPPERIQTRMAEAKAKIENNAQNKRRADIMLEGNIKFWEQHIHEYESLFAKLNCEFSFDLEWPFINYHYKGNLQEQIVEEKLFSFLLDGQSNLQGPLFRIYRSLNQLQKRDCITFKDEIFEDQFITLYNFQKFERFKNAIKKEKKQNQNDQLWAFVEQHFDPNSTHDRLREPPRHNLLGFSNQGSKTTLKTNGSQLDSIQESMKELDDTLNGADESLVLKTFEDDQMDDPVQSFQSDSTLLTNEINRMAQSSNYPDDNASQSNEEESKNSPNRTSQQGDRESQIKFQYVDAISRVFYHLRGALDEPNFLTERVSQRMQMLRGASADAENEETILNLEELFKNVLEDDRNQPDQSMKLQLDAFLIKRYFSKLEKPMQDRLMGLLKDRLTFVTKMMDLNFERQNYKYDRVLKFMSNLDTVTDKRLNYFNTVYNSLKVNRFIYKNWGRGLSLTTDEINDMIRQVYFDDMQTMRSMHHQTENLSQSFELNRTRQTEQQNRMLAARRQRQSAARGVRASMTSTIDFIEEQSQLDNIQRAQHQLTRSIDASQMHNSETNSMMNVRNMNNQMTGSFIVAPGGNQDGDGRINININTISSNLIYVATVLNHDFIKKQIKEVNLESLMMLSSMVDSSGDDYFLIYDLYKIYLFCVKRVIMEHRQNDGTVDPRHEQFLTAVHDTFFQQLIQRIWDQLKNDPEMLKRDEQIREYYRFNGTGSAKLIEKDDMNLLYLSSSDEESDEEGDGSSINKYGRSTDDSSIYATAIQTLLTVNQTNHLEQKKNIIERSVLTAIRAYKQSNLLTQPSKNVSEQALNRILEHIIGECYLRDPSFSLHLNIAFVIMILTKNRHANPASIQSVSKYIGQLCKQIDSNVLLIDLQ